ncbi:MAG: dioxygenase, partial [Sphingomonadales bacterium]
MTNILKSQAVQDLLDRASGISESGGDPRLKAIVRDILEALMGIVEKHDISEDEFWRATQYLQDGAG